MLIIGIDPGLTGAIADSDGGVYDIPTQVKGKGQGIVKQEIDGVAVYNILYMLIKERNYKPEDVAIYIEQQVYRKKFKPKHAGGGEIPQGGSSIFSLGDTYGTIRTASDLTHSRVVHVLPSVWKRKMKLTSDKEACRARAIELFPQSYDNLRLKKHHNRAEALLLVEYGLLMEGIIL
jgi:crossover junction endodeoxyribonuclease RuvC